MVPRPPHPEKDYPDVENQSQVDGSNRNPGYVEAKPSEVDGGNIEPPEVRVISNANGKHDSDLNGKADDSGSSSSKDDKGAEENGSQNGKTKEVKKMVSLGQLFKYAEGTDVALMLIGSFFALGNGLAQPLSFVVFGELISKFIAFGKEINQLNTTINAQPTLDIEGEMTKFAAYYCYIAVGMLVCAYFQTAFWSLASVRQCHRIRISFFRSILRQEIGWFDTNDSGELSTRLTDDITKIQNGIGDKVGMVIQSVTMFFAGFILGFYYGWKLTLVILALSPLLVITAGVMGKVLGGFTEKEQTAYAKAGSVAEEVIGAIRTVVAFGGEARELERYKNHLSEAESAGVKKGISTGLAFGMFHVVIFSCYALAFWYGSKLIVEGEMQGGSLLIVFFCVMIGAAQMGQAGPNMEALANARGAAYTVYHVIDRVPEIDALSAEGDTLESMTGNIDFMKVHFNYPSRPDIKILKGLNLSIKSGQTVALVGESGCGKSTVIKLVQRFYDPVEGQVTLDGTDIKDLNVGWLRKHVGIVSQEPVLFETSIADNIRMGKDDATQEEIEMAAKNANAHDFISNLPKKYDTYVGEGGAQLSGGQKQRIAIARALVGDPRILLLDEATSALDTESESVVQAALDNASQGRTTIIIAHRLSTVKNADMIAAVQDGVVVETGTHEELLAKKGVYYQLVMLQTFAEEAEIEEQDIPSLTEEEKEARFAMKFMRSVSTLSAGSEEDREAALKLEIALTRKLSKGKIKRAPKEAKKEEKKKEEEVPEEQVEEPPMLRVMKLNAPEWPYLVVGCFFAAIVGAFPVVFAIILSEILKVFAEVDVNKMQDDATFWSLMFLVLGFADGISLFLSSYLIVKAGEALTKRLRGMAFKAMLRQDIGYFDDPTHSTGSLTARLASDASAVQGATSTRLSTVVQIFVMGGSALIIAFIYEWRLTLLIIAFVPFLLFAGAVQTKLHTSFAGEERERLIEAGAVATESIINIRTVASLSKESFFIDKYIGLLEGPYQKSKGRSHIFGLSFGFSGAIMFFCNAAAFRLGGYLVRKREVEFQDMFKVVLAVTFGAMIAGQIASFAPDYVKAKLSAGRLFKLFDRTPSIDSYDEGGKRPERLEGSIEFSDVKFSYPTRPDVEVLRGLDIKIKPGQTVALVGSSGCGKSTSVSLLERFYDIASGALRIDGRDVKGLNLKWLRSKLGIVSQEPVLFDCSIRDNIAYGIDQEERNVFEDDIINAAKSANIHHFISTLPKGYDTEVGDKGTLISGGQKQRIAIARALIRNPSILLLDEATSALDSESEKVVQEALDVAMQGRTSIVIAHRLSTIQNADLIAVVQSGKIVEFGTHQELLAQKGAYYLLNTAQL